MLVRNKGGVAQGDGMKSEPYNPAKVEKTYYFKNHRCYISKSRDFNTDSKGR